MTPRRSLAIAGAFLLASCATWQRTGRLVDERCVHLGVRPASDGLSGVAVTAQVTTDWPLRCAP